jgi:hypothetical protein
MSNFIQDCLAGRVLLDDIDDYVEKWHEGGTNMPIEEFLGMTPTDYRVWAKNPDMLGIIIAAHKQNKPVTKVIERYAMQDMPMAARGVGINEALVLKQWLQKQGMWE